MNTYTEQSARLNTNSQFFVWETRLIDIKELGKLRRDVTTYLEGRGINGLLSDNTTWSLHEVAKNGLEYGVSPVIVRMWVSAEGLPCFAVTDHGTGVNIQQAIHKYDDDELSYDHGLAAVSKLAIVTSDGTPQTFSVVCYMNAVSDNLEVQAGN